jgi:indolepyruvate ferredoxin oxidoreductase alpha subunit
MKQLLSGNEAIAQGAWEAGANVGVGYPGTPSTETLENLSRHDDVYCEWAPNEKVALEVAIGAAMGGARSLVTMKHVGVNVAADPLMSVCNTGVNAGLVVLAADDPSMFSSQNEQDSRNYAAFARIPMLEPADSAEAHAFVQLAFQISEDFDTPVMLRESMRIAHTKSAVDVAQTRTERSLRDFEPCPSKYVMMPGFARARRIVVNERTKKLIEFAEKTDLNALEMRDTSIGIIASGAVYQHVREALPQASVLKIGLSWPLPPQKIAKFAESVDRLYVVEEACDFFALHVHALGISTDEFPGEQLPEEGELTPQLIARAFDIQTPDTHASVQDLPPRPPSLCAGCPHRLVFSTLRDIKAIVTGDIGCYTLGATAPLGAVHSTVDMGASLSMAHGMELAQVSERYDRPVVGVIGDSTFAHSGITSLLGTVYNGGSGTLCILDNRTTAMTGCQGNPCNGVTLTEQVRGISPLDVPAGKSLNIEDLCRAIGVEDVVSVNAQDLSAVKAALESAVSAKNDLSVIVFHSPCRLIDRTQGTVPTIEDCRACGRCIKLGCPAIGKDEQGRAFINPDQCVGCDQCIQTCPFDCISKKGE